MLKKTLQSSLIPRICYTKPMSSLKAWLQSENSHWLITATLIFVLVGAIALTYSASLTNNFVTWDDDWRVYNNPYVHGLSLDNITHAFTNTDPRYWPLTDLSFQLIYDVFGLNPTAFHAVSLLLHISSALLVWWLLYLLSSYRWLSFSLALIFALHPLQVETVSWVGNTNGALSAPFFLGALVSYLYYLKSLNIRHYVLTLSLFVLALLASPPAVSLPAVLLLIDYRYHRPFGKKILLEKVPFFALGLLFAGATLLGAQHDLTSEWLPTAKLTLIPQSLVFHLKQFVYPLELSAIYPIPEGLNILFSLGVLTLLIFLLIYNRRYTREVVFGASFFIITILPPLWLIASQNMSVIAADRYMYIPGIGLLYIAGHLATRLYRKTAFSGSKKIFSITAAVIIASTFLAIFSHQRSLVWGSSERLYLDILQKYPDSVQARQNLGDFYQSEGNYDKAISQYKEVLVLDPSNSETYNSIGIVYMNTNQPEKARANFDQALEFDADNLNPRNNLTSLYIQQGELEKAISETEAVLEKDSGNATAYSNLAAIYQEQGQLSEAIEAAEAALESDPDFANAHNTLGQIYIEQGHYSEAQSEFEKFLALQPNNSLAHNNLGTALAKQGYLQEAKAEYEKAVEVDPHNTQVIQNLQILNGVIRRQ